MSAVPRIGTNPEENATKTITIGNINTVDSSIGTLNARKSPQNNIKNMKFVKNSLPVTFNVIYINICPMKSLVFVNMLITLQPHHEQANLDCVPEKAYGEYHLLWKSY